MVVMHRLNVQSARSSLPRVGRDSGAWPGGLAQQGWGEMRRHASNGSDLVSPPPRLAKAWLCAKPSAPTLPTRGRDYLHSSGRLVMSFVEAMPGNPSPVARGRMFVPTSSSGDAVDILPRLGGGLSHMETRSRFSAVGRSTLRKPFRSGAKVGVKQRTERNRSQNEALPQVQLAV